MQEQRGTPRHSQGAMILDACSEWLDSAQKTIRPYIPRSAYARLVTFYDRQLSERRIGRDTFARMQRLKTAAVDDRKAECFQLPMLQHPIWLRPGTPDVHEVLHTVVRANYGRWLPKGPVRLIIDAGAYIGDTTAWYLSRFPNATVVALEPNPRSFAMLERNCRAYGSRCALLQGALWSSRIRLEVNRGSSGTTDSSVGPVSDADTDRCDTVTVDDLLSRFDGTDVDIFKCDIEGAEVGLFADSSDRWIRRIRAIYVDVHSPEARDVVTAVARRHGFTLRHWRELFVLSRS